MKIYTFFAVYIEKLFGGHFEDIYMYIYAYMCIAYARHES